MNETSYLRPHRSYGFGNLSTGLDEARNASYFAGLRATGRGLRLPGRAARGSLVAPGALL